MTKAEFYDKWKCFDLLTTIGENREQMMDDLDKVIHTTVLEWKNFVDAEVCRSIDLDEWQRQEADAIQNRN